MNTKELQRIVSSISLAVSKRSPVDWHSRILVESSGDSMLFAASSGSGTAWMISPCEAEPFRVAVRSSDLQQLVSACRSPELSIAVTGSKLSFTGEHGVLSLAYSETMPKLAGGWPSRPEIPEKRGVTILAGDLRFALSCAAQGMGESEDAQFSLDSLMLTSEQGTLTVTSTDGRKAVRVPIECTQMNTIAVQVASVSVRLFMSFVGHLAEDTLLSIGTTNGDVVVWSDSAAVFLRRPAKKLPKLGGVWAAVTKPAAVEFDIASADMIAALRESTIGYGKEDDNGVVIAVDPMGLTVASKPDHDNKLESRIDIPTEGAELVCVFDSVFLASLLRCTPSARVRLIDVGNAEVTGYNAVLIGDRGYNAIVSGMQIRQDHIVRGETIKKPALATS